ncbi:MAG: FkbM family methyltransferase, partial [Verrucomicrobiota bacterium]
HAYIRPGAGVRTRLLTLDEYIESARIDRVAFTKMDVEGYELFALHGARRSIAAGKLPVVYFELKGPLVQRFGKTVQDVLAFFRASGYRMFHVRQQDFSALKLAPDREIAGLAAREVGDYPDDLWTDLLAVHASAEHIGIRARDGA